MERTRIPLLEQPGHDNRIASPPRTKAVQRQTRKTRAHDAQGQRAARAPFDFGSLQLKPDPKPQQVREAATHGVQAKEEGAAAESEFDGNPDKETFTAEFEYQKGRNEHVKVTTIYDDQGKLVGRVTERKVRNSPDSFEAITTYEGSANRSWLQRLMDHINSLSFNLIVGSVGGGAMRARLSFKLDFDKDEQSIEAFYGSTVKASTAWKKFRGKEAVLAHNFTKMAESVLNSWQKNTLMGKDNFIPSVSAGFMISFGKGHTASQPEQVLPLMLQFQITIAGVLINLMFDEDFLIDNAVELMKEGDFSVQRLKGKVGMSFGSGAKIPFDIAVFQEIRILKLSGSLRNLMSTMSPDLIIPPVF